MDLKELNNLDFSTIGDWPPLAKGILISFLCAVLAGGWYWFFTLEQLDRLSRVEAQETELRATFESKQRLAANLETHREQLAQMEEFLQDLLRQLPGSMALPWPRRPMQSPDELCISLIGLFCTQRCCNTS